MTFLRALPREVAWMPWGADAFARARDERKPVLLCIVTAWSESCRHMDQTSYADPAIAFLINDGFVPVRVDADRRPDVSERYSLGGWPTTAFLTPDGDVLGGGTYVDAARMPRVLEDVRSAFHRDRPDAAVSRHPSAIDATGPAPDPQAICARVLAEYDDEHGGFGRAAKFPHTAPLQLALAMHARAHDAAHLETIVTTTLDAMGWGGLYDEEEGGFFRCSTSRDWRQPLREKTLEVNAQLLRVYADAAGAFGIGRFGERAADVLRYVERALADPDGGWYGSQRSIDGGVDRTLYADANALMASAVLRAAALFDAESLRRDAVRSLERVLLACYRPGQGVAHYFDGRAHVRGLLADQIAMAAAQLDAHDATGDVVYEMMAEELAHYAVRELWDAEAGGFFDRPSDPSDVGLMRVRLKPFVWNCEAARAFRRLAVASGAAEFARRADAALSAVAPAARAQGPLAAHYVLALEQAG